MAQVRKPKAVVGMTTTASTGVRQGKVRPLSLFMFYSTFYYFFRPSAIQLPEIPQDRSGKKSRGGCGDDGERSSRGEGGNGGGGNVGKELFSGTTIV